MDIRARDINSILSFTCNICDAPYEIELSHLGRDSPLCPKCACPPRTRAVVNILSLTLFGRSSAISDFPSRPDLTGIGLSDPEGLGKELSSKVGYRNTHFSKEPRLDITDVPAELYGTLDFLFACDVFEHVAPPVERAFGNSFRLLKPGGILLLTVPAFPSGETIEHYPNLNEYEIIDFNGARVLVNRTVEGRWEVFDDLVFHGGEGNPLEVRRFSRPSVLRHLDAAGFEEITEWTAPQPEFGIPPFPDGRSVPISARRPGR